jgi:hypothetical protein
MTTHTMEKTTRTCGECLIAAFVLGLASVFSKDIGIVAAVLAVGAISVLLFVEIRNKSKGAIAWGIMLMISMFVIYIGDQI